MYHAPSLPTPHLRLIQDGISYEEFRRRFGMSDAAMAEFARRERMASIVEPAKICEPPARDKPPSTAAFYGRPGSQRRLIIEELTDHPDGLNAAQLAQSLQIQLKQVSNVLSVLAAEGVIKANKVEGFTKTYKLNQTEKPDLVSNTAIDMVTNIKLLVCQYFNIGHQSLVGSGISPIFAKPRAVAIYLLRSELNLPWPNIAAALGGRTKAAINTTLRRGEELMLTDPEFIGAVTDLRAALAGNNG